jgi:CRISPR/Cas system-associated exonuclease Cas4 (RecB family)
LTPGTSQVVRASRATLRIERARAWLADRAPGEEVLVVAATGDAASDLLRNAATARGAAFGWHRATLARFAAQLATPVLAERGLAPLGALAAEALSARVLHEMRARGGLGRFEAAADGPGLSRAIARTLAELRMARVSRDALAATSPDLVPLSDAFEAELTHTGLADRAEIFRIATALARDVTVRAPLLGLPTLLLDVAIESAAERDFIAALAARAPELFATVPAGDDATATALAAALDAPIEELEAPLDATSLTRLQTNLFGGAAAQATDPDECVVVLSAPGESRECVEIARRCLQFAAKGVRFDRIAVLLRSPDEYRAHLSEAFARAGVPAHFARAALRPDPSGRAFLALVACAAERLSANRFAEYLSLGEVPDADAAGEPPAAARAGDRWVAPDEELVQEAIAEALGEASRQDAEPGAAQVEDPDAQPVAGGVLRAPRRWEQLLVDAAVIGGRERWERRLGGLAHELASQLADAEREDAAGVAALRLRRTLADLEALRGFALPLIGVLDALPVQASWQTWTAMLASLATRALRSPDRVLAVLAELAPMAAVDAVPIDEVRLVLSRRLLEVAVPPPKSRYGRVFVAPAESARGMAFDVVFVPGLAERLFPRKIAEEPILLDAARASLDAGLATNTQRVANERRALRLAVGAARDRVVLSYPRLDLDEARPRVPSFYALEALRAAEGRLPGFDELAKRAETLTLARVGWPAPRAPEDAIDAAEHDLAVLDTLLRDPEPRPGTARYLLDANPHLGRALRFRGRRWWKRWTWADGLVAAPEPGREAAAARGLEAIRDHALVARSFSPTALQHFAACPYRFLLQAVHRLAPREVPEAIEELDPQGRGSLVHEVQFELFQRLEAEALLPVRPAHAARARALLDEVLDAAAARARDRLAPAIERVWQDGIESIRADLREWLRRAAEDESGFVPWRFELSFGLPGRSQADPHSTPDPVSLDCGIQLRGSIDLVERRTDGALRATDHKTGRDRVGRGAITGGGEALQPVLYALALEQLFAGSSVTGGRLYYCTATGGFEERVVPLDAEARAAAHVVAEALDAALSKPFLPAAPAKGACTYCDYRVVCGPYEELRSARKPAAELEALTRVRELR